MIYESAMSGCDLYNLPSAYLRRGVQGVQPPPPQKNKNKINDKGCEGGGRYLLTYFLGLKYFQVVEKFSRGGEKFSRGVEIFSGGVEKCSGGRWLRNFRGGGENLWGGCLMNFRGEQFKANLNL